MTESNQPTNKDWVEHWRRIAPKLDEIRRRELREFDYAEQLPIIDALLQMGIDRRVSRKSSGLVEFQRLLAKAKR
jgi:hypothetical protein